MSKYVLGVDPGATGTIVVLTSDGGYVNHTLMPMKMIGKSNRVCGHGISDFLEKYLDDISHAWVEQVGAMPGQGVTSMFSFGYQAGGVQCALEALGIKCHRITPQKWKKYYDLNGQGKDSSRLLLLDELGDTVKDIKLKGKGQSLADAILLARAGIGGKL